MRRFFTIFFPLLILSLLINPVNLFASEKRVLLLSSYHPAFPTFFQQIDGIKSVLDPAGVKLDVEFMDSKRFFAVEHFAAFHNLLKIKLDNSSPYDVVITSDDNALKFSLKYMEELFPGTPIVFCGVNDRKLALSMNSNNLVTGVIEEVSMRETLNLILKLRPKTEKIYVIVDGTLSGQGDLATFEKQKINFPEQIFEVLALQHLSWEELERRLAKLSESSSVLLLSAYRDKNLITKSFDEALKIMKQYSEVPIFHLWEHGLGQGVIGGKVISHFEQGAAAGSIATDIIAGTIVKDIDVVAGGNVNKIIFDYEVLNKFGVSSTLLPDNIEVLNKPISVFKNHRNSILIALLFIALLLLSSGVLLISLFRLRKAEEKIRRSEERFALAMEANRDGLWDWEIDTNVVYYSPGYKVILGYGPDEVPAHVDSWVDLIHSEDREATLKINSECIENKREDFEVEFRMQAKDGGWRWICGRGKAVARHENGRAARVVGTHSDITERKQVESELIRLRNYLNSIINSMPSVLIGLDVNGVVTQWNSKAEEVTGISFADAEGRVLSDVFPRLSLRMKWLDESISKHEIHAERNVYSHNSGTERYEDITIYPLSDVGVEGVVVRVDDVTQRVRLEEMIVQSEKMMSVGSLAAGMAHEINNPLGAIIQGSQNLNRRLSLQLPANFEVAQRWNLDLENMQGYLQDRDIYKIIEGISSSGLRAGEIISNMLGFSRKSCKSSVNYNLSDLLDSSLEQAVDEYDSDRKFDLRQIKIKREYGENIPAIFCEGTEIKQVFLNLIKNCVHAIAEKNYIEMVPCLTLRLFYESSMVSVEVEDNGLGMDEACRKRAFEPFFTTKQTGQGTGLGLSVSYFIITDQHKGCMKVLSSPGEWTRFIVQLPVNPSC